MTWGKALYRRLRPVASRGKAFCKRLYVRCTGRGLIYDWQDLQGFDPADQPGLAPVCRRFDPEAAPLISIVTPYYNADAFIRQTFQCVVNQTFPYFEWIIVDDGSTGPAALETLERLGRMDSRIKVFHIPRQGPAAARNEAIARSAADLLFPLDADDLIEPSYLEVLYWAMDAQPEAGWAYADSCSFGELNFLWSNPFFWKTMKYQNLLSNAALIRKRVLADIGFYATRQAHYHEDWYAWLRMMARGVFPVHVQGEALFWYRRKPHGEMKTVEQQVRRSNRRLIAQAARELKRPVYAIEYPFDETTPVTDFECSAWPLTLKDDAARRGALWLIDRMDDDFQSALNRALAAEPGVAGVIVLHGKPRDWRQALRRRIPDYFVLDRFLPEKRWTAFVSYYKMTRAVKSVVLDDRLASLLPWLRSAFPDCSFVPSGAWIRTAAGPGVKADV